MSHHGVFLVARKSHSSINGQAFLKFSMLMSNERDRARELVSSAEVEFYAVLLLRASRAMNLYNVYQPVKNSLATVGLSSSEVLSNSISIGRVTSGQP